MSAAQQLLDRVQSVARLAELEAEPGAYAARVEEGLPPADPSAHGGLAGLDAEDAQARGALAAIDALIERATRLRIDHALHDDTSLAAPTRRVFASTVLGYVDRLELLEARARDAAARGGAADPGGIAAQVADVARGVLALREALRAGVLDVIAGRARGAAAIAAQHALDRRLDEPLRRRWSAARREFEALAGAPARIAEGPLAARLASWPEQLDEPDPASEPTFADLIELD